MIHRSLFVLLIALLSLVASIANADIVTLKDGTVYEGVITKENGAQVTIVVTISNIKTTKTFPRYKVKSIEHKAIEEVEKENKPTRHDADDDSTEKPERSTPRERTKRKRVDTTNRTLFMTIPVTKMIGQETNSTGLRKALNAAQKKRIQHVVFEIDSPGGYVYDAVETLEVLKEFDDELTYHAFVTGGAISAASVYVAAADDIFVRPDARVGGAVAYTEDDTTNATEVDAKFNSIWAAEIAARADSKGYPGELFRAMVVLEAEIWMNDEGEISASRNGAGSEQLDSRTTILTIRASQMVKAKMATEFSGQASELGELLGIEGWVSAKGVGEKIMKAASRDRVRLNDKMEKALDLYTDSIEKLKNNDPRQYKDYYWAIYRNAGGFIVYGARRGPDPTSLRLWRKRCERAIWDCDSILNALREVARVSQKAEKIGALHLGVPSDLGDDVFQEFSDIRSWISGHRYQIPDDLMLHRP